MQFYIIIIYDYKQLQISVSNHSFQTITIGVKI